MPLLITDLAMFKSLSNHGGSITAVPADGFNVLGSFLGENLTQGETRYACCYVRNLSTTNAAKRVKLAIDSVTQHAGISVAIGLGLVPKNTPEPVLANANTAPTGVDFSPATGFDNATLIGDLTIGQYAAIWIRMVVPAGAAPKNQFRLGLSLFGATGE